MKLNKTNYPLLYKAWDNMKQRTRKHKIYMDKNIKYCEKWETFKGFTDDMLDGFKDGLTLDRKNNDLGYSKDNCRWTTKEVQSRNTRILQSNNTSGYRGVRTSFKRKNGVVRYKVVIVVNNKDIYLGSFKNAYDGALVYDKYIIDNKLEHTTNGLIKKN